jgi:hypothetical protein
VSVPLNKTEDLKKFYRITGGSEHGGAKACGIITALKSKVSGS